MQVISLDEKLIISKKMAEIVENQEAMNEDELALAKHLLLGVTDNAGNEEYEISVTYKQLLSSAELVGATGSGKTNFLNHVATTIIDDDLGLFSLDPHGEHFDFLLDYITKEIITLHADGKEEEAIKLAKRLIILDFSDKTFCHSWNPFYLQEKHRDIIYTKTQNIMDSLLMGYDSTDLDTQKRLNRWLSASLYILHEQRIPFSDCRTLLLPTDKGKAFRSQLIRKCKNSFYKQELEILNSVNNNTLNTYLESSINALTPFWANPHLARIFSQTDSCIDFEEIIKQGKIVLCCISPRNGLIDSKTAKKIGAMLLANYTQAARLRKPDTGKPYFLLIDEASEFLSIDTAKSLSELRKYRVPHLISFQFDGQVVERSRLLLSAIRSQARTKIFFNIPLEEDREKVVKDVMINDIDNPIKFIKATLQTLTNFVEREDKKVEKILTIDHYSRLRIENNNSSLKQRNWESREEHSRHNRTLHERSEQETRLHEYLQGREDYEDNNHFLKKEQKDYRDKVLERGKEHKVITSDIEEQEKVLRLEQGKKSGSGNVQSGRKELSDKELKKKISGSGSKRGDGLEKAQSNKSTSNIPMSDVLSANHNAQNMSGTVTTTTNSNFSKDEDENVTAKEDVNIQASENNVFSETHHNQIDSKNKTERSGTNLTAIDFNGSKVIKSQQQLEVIGQELNTGSKTNTHETEKESIQESSKHLLAIEKGTKEYIKQSNGMTQAELEARHKQLGFDRSDVVKITEGVQRVNEPIFVTTYEPVYYTEVEIMRNLSKKLALQPAGMAIVKIKEQRHFQILTPIVPMLEDSEEMRKRRRLNMKFLLTKLDPNYYLTELLDRKIKQQRGENKLNRPGANPRKKKQHNKTKAKKKNKQPQANTQEEAQPQKKFTGNCNFRF